MEQEQDVEQYLKTEADRLSGHYGGAPVIIIVGGAAEGTVEMTTTGWSSSGVRRFRDVLGILVEAIQKESISNLQPPGERRRAERRSGDRRKEMLPPEQWPNQASRAGDRRMADRRSIPQLLADARELLKDADSDD